jgi:hypothetical protein
MKLNLRGSNHVMIDMNRLKSFDGFIVVKLSRDLRAAE